VALAARVADDRTAEVARRTLLDRFLAPGGLRTTLQDTTQQWDGRNGWAPLQWWAIDGLRAYGFADEAETVRIRWLRTCDTGFANDGVLLEKYDVDDPGLRAEGGEYEVQEGFGWTNGVYIALSQP
jgi:alpha,alpha-trehalase